MKKMIGFLGLATVMLSACDTPQTGTGASPFMAEVPEGVLAIAAPGQDMSAVRIDPVDGCYMYRHVGPVETTPLPLRAKNGRPICARANS